MASNYRRTDSGNCALLVPSKFAKFHFCPNSLPCPSTWPDRPLLVRYDATVHSVNGSEWSEAQSLQPEHGAEYRFEPTANGHLQLVRPVYSDANTKLVCQGGSVKVGTIFPIDTPLFKGHAMIRLPTEGTRAYFDGHKRLSSVVIQGHFTERLSFADVYTGQEFCHPLTLPQPGGSLIISSVLKGIRALAPSLEANISDSDSVLPNETFLMSPLAATTPRLHVSHDHAIDLHPTCEVDECTQLLGGVFAAQAAPYKERKKILGSLETCRQHTFEPDLEYTFDFFNSMLDFEEWSVMFLGKQWSCSRTLSGQPIRIMAKSLTHSGPSSYLWNLELWHEKQLEEAKTAA